MDTSLLLGKVSGSGFSSSTGLLANNAKAQETERRFSALVDGIRAGCDDNQSDRDGSRTGVRGAGLNGVAGLASSEVSSDPRLPGDFISSFALDNPTPADRAARPEGAAANSGFKGTIDKSSKLYEQAMELESYFVKMMLSSMRQTVSKSGLTGENDFAGKMYEDMLYDELSRDVTKSAGFGLADQVYLQLSGQQ